MSRYRSTRSDDERHGRARQDDDPRRDRPAPRYYERADERDDASYRASRSGSYDRDERYAQGGWRHAEDERSRGEHRGPSREYMDEGDLDRIHPRSADRWYESRERHERAERPYFRDEREVRHDRWSRDDDRWSRDDDRHARSHLHPEDEARIRARREDHEEHEHRGEVSHSALRRAGFLPNERELTRYGAIPSRSSAQGPYHGWAGGDEGRFFRPGGPLGEEEDEHRYDKRPEHPGYYVTRRTLGRAPLHEEDRWAREDSWTDRPSERRARDHRVSRRHT